MSAEKAKTERGQDIEIQIDEGTTIKGSLFGVEGATGIVLFAHGSGSSRYSVRNRQVASIVTDAGLSAILIDLLTEEEELVDLQTMELRFNIDLLSKRVIGATQWLLKNPDTHDLRIGYFGSSTGASAALVAAAMMGEAVKAIVSRGGRPDLAGNSLAKVKAPTLLIVGGDDSVVIDLNQQAFLQLEAEKELAIIPGAGHLFEEPGKLAEVAAKATDWFKKYLTAGD